MSNEKRGAVLEGQKQVEHRFPVSRYRKDFPILSEKVYGKPLVYLDNAATTQKPKCVMDALSEYYSSQNANIHRGIYQLSERATLLYEETREKCARFIQVPDSKAVIFVRGTTEGINLIAESYGRSKIQKGDEILISAMEHHSNIVPWQILCAKTGAALRVAPINDSGELLLDEFKSLLSPKTKLVSVAHVSNVLGTVNPVREIVQMAHRAGAVVVIDGAQAVPHCSVNVRELDCDFYVFSAHKMFGPTGVGVLYGKKKLLEEMPPYQGGGDMISSVSFEKTEYNVLPHKFEAGTPHISGVIAFGRAIDYINEISLGEIEHYEEALLRYGTEQLSRIPGLRIIGTAKEKRGVISFVLGEIHAHDVGTILDREGIAIRAGHHCAMPLMERFRVPATARASFAFYNTREEVDRLVSALHQVREVFQ